MERRRSGAGAWALIAMTAAWLVQGLLATSPVMIVSDAVFHANTLARVAGGDFFPTSVTQHATPFRFPYGVSFYAVLAPLFRAGIDGVALVRVGAAVAGVLASAALFLVLLRAYGAAAAGLAVVLLQTLPATFDVAYSYGNLSNAFGQSATVGFFAWWAGTRAGGMGGGRAASRHRRPRALLEPDRRGGAGRGPGGRAAARHRPGSRPPGGAGRGPGGGRGVLRPSRRPRWCRSCPRLLEGGGRGTAEAPGVLAAVRIR